MNLVYFSSVSTRISIIFPNILININYSASKLRYTPGMSNTVTTWFLCASIVDVIITLSVVTVGDVYFYLVRILHCIIPSAESLPFIYTDLFFLRTSGTVVPPFFSYQRLCLVAMALSFRYI